MIEHLHYFLSCFNSTVLDADVRLLRSCPGNFMLRRGSNNVINLYREVTAIT